MRYSTVFKFIAVILCAATLVTGVAGAAALVMLTELGGKSVDQAYMEQLENQSIGHAMNAAGIFASETLGGAHRNLINQHWGNDWQNRYFVWSRVGCEIRDSQGNVVWQQPMAEELPAAHTFEFPVGGQYIQVLSVTPHSEFYTTAPETTDASDDIRVLRMPTQEKTEILRVILRYTDGSETVMENGEAFGTLNCENGQVRFVSDHMGEIPMGDGWYVCAIVLEDMAGNVAYEAQSETMVIRSMALEGSAVVLALPGDQVTEGAPAGVTHTEGDYTAYDAIPEQGVTVCQMHVTYGNDLEGDTGSEGISSPDLIGTLFHDHQGNARFHSKGPMAMDIPENHRITGISFRDAQGNVVFEARCPQGVGILTNDENGYLVFRGMMPGTEPEATEPEETTSETTAPVENDPLQTGEYQAVLQADVNVYDFPSPNAKVLTTLEKGVTVTVVRQDTFGGALWGRIPEGWIALAGVLAEETDAGEADRLAQTEPAADLVRSLETVPEETFPTETLQPETIPEQTQAAQEQTESTQPAVPAGQETEKTIYYDSELEQEVVAEYVMAAIPSGYTAVITLTENPIRWEFGWTLLRLAYSLRQYLLQILGICVAAFVVCAVYLCCAAGRRRGSDAVRAGGLNRIPLDLYLGLDAAGLTGLALLAVEGTRYLGNRDSLLALVLAGSCAMLAGLLVVGFGFAFAAQIKTPGGFWWRNSFCGWSIRLMILCCTGLMDLLIKCWIHGKPLLKRLLRWLRRICVQLWELTVKTALWLWDTGSRLGLWVWQRLRSWLAWGRRRFVRIFGLLPITWQFLATGFALVFLLYLMMRTYKVGYILLGFGIFFGVLLYAASAFGILLESAKRMGQGDLETKVSDRVLIGGFRDFAQALNSLAGVAVIAAQKQLKSERMKTELITNVSHDIKTPLTSIINYVDLLQKPHTPQQQEQYLEVLQRQSQRLKKLIDDLMEMSKASTGNMTVEIGVVDAGEAVNQALGEFSDKLERARLTPVFRQPEDTVEMRADGRLVWRVMSNLLGNAVKYALPGTRVYVDLLQMEGKVIISMKNISREELNVNADELLERFVRGDASRNTEGSGLGLNIAKSLMELQRGELQILVDGDLFKVTLIFPGV